MMKSLKHEALDPSSVNVSDEEVVFMNDSLCVIDFTLREANENGGMNKSRKEYIYLKSYDGTYEQFIFIDDEPFQERMAKELERGKWRGTQLSMETLLWTKCTHKIK